MSISSFQDRSVNVSATRGATKTTPVFQPEEFVRQLERTLASLTEEQENTERTAGETSDLQREYHETGPDSARCHAVTDDAVVGKSRAVERERSSHHATESDPVDDSTVSGNGNTARMHNAGTDGRSGTEFIPAPTVSSRTVPGGPVRETGYDVTPLSSPVFGATPAGETAPTGPGLPGIFVAQPGTIVPVAPLTTAPESAFRDVARIATTGAVTIFSLGGKTLDEKRREVRKWDEESEDAIADGGESPESVRNGKAGSVPGVSSESASTSSTVSPFLRLFQSGFPSRMKHEEHVGHGDLSLGNDYQEIFEAAAAHITARNVPQEVGREEKSQRSTAEEPPLLETGDRVAFVRRVAAAMQSVANREGVLRMRLHPESLGSIALRVRIRDHRLAARLFAETGAARDLLLRDLDELRENLERLGFTVESLDVAEMNEK